MAEVEDTGPLVADDRKSETLTPKKSQRSPKRSARSTARSTGKSTSRGSSSPVQDRNAR